MTKHDDTYTCEHCGKYFYIDRVNGKKGPGRHECTCGRMAGSGCRFPYRFF